MKLIELVISIFETRWNDKMFVNIYNDYRKFSDFLKEVLQFYYLITEAQTAFNTNLKIGLWATNSTSYIAAYIALIIKNVDFYLIPPKMKGTMVVSIIANADINVLLTCPEMPHFKVARQVNNFPYFKFVYDIKDKTFMYVNTHGRDFIFGFNALPDEQYQVTHLRELVTLDLKLNNNRKNRETAVFSSGSESIYPKAVYFYDEQIYQGLLKLIHTDLLPNIENKIVYPEIDFATAPIWAILWPLYSNCQFAFSNTEAEIVITNNGLFEQHWHHVSKNLYETKILGKLLLKSWLNFLFLFCMRIQLKKYFHFGTTKQGIIIINAFLAPRVMKTIIGYLPIYTTYGIQETNQIVTINNYSTKILRKENCVGEPLEGILINIRETNLQSGEGSLILIADHFANTVDFEKGGCFDSRDHASIINDDNKILLNIYGKIKYAIKDTCYYGSNYENIERILKNIPYFKEVLIYFDDSNNGYVLVFPNSEIIEANDFGLIDFNNFIKVYKSILMDTYNIDFVKSIKIVYYDFLKTHDLKIKKIMYFKAIQEDLKNFEDVDF